MFNKLGMLASRMTVAAQCKIREFVRKENGDVNIVSIVVLIGIAVLLAIVFKDAIAKLLKQMFESIGQNATDAAGTGVDAVY